MRWSTGAAILVTAAVGLSSHTRAGEADPRPTGTGARITPSLAAALSKPPLVNRWHWVQAWPVGFSNKGHFAVVLGGSGYQGECEPSECGDGGRALEIYDLATDRKLASLRVEELVDPADTPSPRWEGKPTRDADIKALLEKYSILPDSVRPVRPDDKGVFSLGKRRYTIEHRRVVCPEPGKRKRLPLTTPCRPVCVSDDDDDCDDDGGTLETVVTRIGVGSKVVTRFSSYPMLSGTFYEGAVASRSGTHLALLFVDARWHEGSAMTTGRIVGADLRTRFKK